MFDALEHMWRGMGEPGACWLCSWASEETPEAPAATLLWRFRLPVELSEDCCFLAVGGECRGRMQRMKRKEKEKSKRKRERERKAQKHIDRVR